MDLVMGLRMMMMMMISTLTYLPNPIHEKSQQDPSNFETLPYDVIPEMETPSTSPSTDLTAIDARIALLQNLAFNC